jgi:hypothetical protein
MPTARGERTRRLTQGMWLIGIGMLLLHDRLWPDILYVVGTILLVEAYCHPERRRSPRAGIVLIVLGMMIACPISFAEILILVGVTMLVFRPLSTPSPAPKPMFDARLE